MCTLRPWKFSRIKPSLSPARLPSGLVALLPALCLFAVACNRQNNSDSETAHQGARSASALGSTSSNAQNGPITGTNAVEQKVAHLLDVFHTAPSNTQSRVQAAVEVYRAGHQRQAIAQLKMVDADSDLNPEQVDSIRVLIREIHQLPSSP